MLFGISACGVLMGEDTRATLEAGESLFATESVALVGTSVAQRTEVADAIETSAAEIARISSVNVQLHATLAAGSTPTVAVVPGQASIDQMYIAERIGSSEGEGIFIVTGVAGSVHESTGCAIYTGTSFSSSVDHLYLAIQAFDLQAGTPVRVEWLYEGELRISQDWTVDRNSSERCLWFRLSRADTPLDAGLWMVRLYAGSDYFPVHLGLRFYIVDEN